MKRHRFGRRRSCEGKVRHTSRTSALAHRARLLTLGDTRINVYRCHHCRHWHVGHYRTAR